MWLTQAWSNFTSTSDGIIGWQSSHRCFTHHFHTLQFIQILWRNESMFFIILPFEFEFKWAKTVIMVLRVHLTTVASKWVESAFENSQRSIFPIYCYACPNGWPGAIITINRKLIITMPLIRCENFHFWINFHTSVECSSECWWWCHFSNAWAK